MTKKLIAGPPPLPGKKVLIGEIDGPPGESAYEIAKRLGFAGTEQEWISSLGSGGLIDPVTGLPPETVVEALSESIIDPYDDAQTLAYRLGKI